MLKLQLQFILNYIFLSWVLYLHFTAFIILDTAIWACKYLRNDIHDLLVVNVANIDYL